MTRSKATWEYWGEKDPYYGVFGAEKSQEEFWESGKQYVADMLTTIRTHIFNEFNPTRALDFGCGPGRIVLPLSDKCREVVGLDTSESMLREARANRKASNVHLINKLSDLQGDFDLIHSTAVFIHIPPREGMRIISNLLDHLAPGGVLVIQFYSRCTANPLLRILVRLRYLIPLFNKIRNALKGRPLAEPAMELYVYDVLNIIQTLSPSIVNLYVEAGRDGDFMSLKIYGQRN